MDHDMADNVVEVFLAAARERDPADLPPMLFAIHTLRLAYAAQARSATSFYDGHAETLRAIEEQLGQVISGV